MLSRPVRRALSAVAISAAAALVVAGCAAQPSAADTSSEASVAPRAVEHARGVTEVPEQPQRVVTLEPLELDTAVSVGITPVGAAVASNVAGIPAYLEVDGVEPVGTVPEPDLEAIAALKPDLILGTEARHSKLYDQLSAIAPTVFIATQADPWRDNAELIGQALGREDEVAAQIAAVDDRCTEIGAAHDLAGKTAQVIRPRDETTLSLYGPVSFAGSLLECVGYATPEHDWADGLQADISPENILDARADAVFVTASDTTDASAIPAAITQNADAFPSVTLVDTSTWVAGVGPRGAQSVLTDIERFLDGR
ncbi:iron ABC transporter substrate-binding protein [Microbacterium sp. TS-1]|jgi:iron complex transport system substrate-binding protein|uniref:Iron ABC transporter substrate-binding protein n=1 Tax=Microbacterium arborescens TaxID=33883 RepID=A0ABX2WHX3_9MICO|nr:MULTISPECIES: iron-siderophore ABC transporter substrate-binding protein [Microbacterium]APF33874.1 iron ABC transporter substrate-binding protein [Microbacterium paludicola]OAZ40815.1 iron ABC transporter substrate-binding protein [Microbacterium arborescens]GAD33627.1 iron ABC transporter substrate-binding protein [Microbacterium sp. TS-1]